MTRNAIAVIWVLLGMTAAAQECPLYLGRTGHGFSLAAAKEGDLLIHGDGRALVIADISDPTNPTELGRVELPTQPLDLTVAFGHAYAACGEAGLVAVDISDPSHPIVTRTLDEGLVMVTRVARKDRWLYLVDEWRFVAIFSLDDAGQPRLASYLSILYAYPSAVAIQGDYLYWVGDPEFKIFDITVPDQPIPIGGLDGWANDVAVEGPTAVLARGSSGSWTVDVSNPHAPCILWKPPRDCTEPLAFDAVRVALKDGILAWAGINVNLTDLADPVLPKTIAVLGSGGQDSYYHQGAVLLQDDLLISAQGDSGLEIYRRGTPSVFEPLGRFPTNWWWSQRVLMQPGLIYVLTERSLEVYGTTDPAAPALIGSLPLDYNDQNYDLKLYDHFLLFSAARAGIFIVDVGDPAHPVLAGQFHPGSNYYQIEVQGCTAYATSCSAWDSCTATALDLTDPYNVQEIGTTEVVHGSLCLTGDRLYVVGIEETQIFDLTSSDPFHPTGRWPFGGYFCAASENALFVAGESSNDVFDLSVPDLPRPVSNIPRPYGWEYLSVDSAVMRDGVLFLWHYFAAFCDPDPCPPFYYLSAWDVRDPANPIGRGFWDSRLYGYHMDVLGDLAAFAGYGFSLVRLHLDTPAAPLFKEPATAPVARVAVGAERLCTFDFDGRLTAYDLTLPGRPAGIRVAYGPKDDQLLASSLFGRQGLFLYDFNGLYLADLSDIDHPVMKPFPKPYSNFIGVGTDGSYAYAVRQDGEVHAWDFSDPANPADLGTMLLKERANSFAVGNGIAVASTDTGLIVLSLADPAHPAIAGRLSAGSAVGRVVLDGRRALADTTDGILIVDCIIPEAPALLSKWTTGWRVGLAEGGLFVSGEGIFDLSRPDQPTEVGTLAMGQTGWGLSALIDGILYAAGYADGIITLDLRSCLGGAPVPPVPGFDYYWYGTKVGTPIQFQGWVRGNPADWVRWDFGDGGTASELSPSHTFSRYGRFSVTLTAGNASGEGRASDTIYIGNSVQSPPITSEEGLRWLVPAYAHCPGAGASFWTTGLTLHNPADREVQAFLYLLFSAWDNSGRWGYEVRLAPGATLAWDSLSEELAWESAVGALLLRSDGPLEGYATIRTAAPDGGTYGQAVPFIPFDSLFVAGETANLIGLEQTAARRTNVGFASLSETAIALHARYFTGDGTIIGEKDYLLPPFSHLQDAEVLRSFGVGQWDNAFMEVTSTSTGARFTAYASVVDNRTQDPSFIPAMR